MQKIDFNLAQRKKIYMMSYNSAKNGKAFVSTKTIIKLLESSNMLCHGCGQQMVWFAKENTRRVMSLQHNKDGTLELICRSCNTRHSFCPEDSYYTCDPNLQFCRRCKQWKPLVNFGHKTSKINKRESYCYQCNSDYANAWNKLHREAINTRRRELREIKNDRGIIYGN